MIDSFARIIDGKLCISSAVMVDIFQVTRASLGNWAKNGCPKSKAGWWPLAEVIAWRGLAQSKGGVSKDLSDTALKLKYDAEYKRLQGEQLELKNAIAAGEYVPKAQIVADLSRYMIELKRSLTGLSRELANEVGMHVDPTTARRIEAKLAVTTNKALERMSAGEIYDPPRRKKTRS